MLPTAKCGHQSPGTMLCISLFMSHFATALRLLLSHLRNSHFFLCVLSISGDSFSGLLISDITKMTVFCIQNIQLALCVPIVLVSTAGLSVGGAWALWPLGRDRRRTTQHSVSPLGEDYMPLYGDVGQLDDLWHHKGHLQWILHYQVSLFALIWLWDL